MPEPIQQSVANHDLSARMQSTSAVAASPQAATETVIATLALSNFGDLQVTSGVRLRGWAALTVGTAGVSANLRIRQTNVTGNIVAATGATTATATNLEELTVLGFDATPGVSTYVLTLTMGSASAASTVSAVQLAADII